MKVVEAMLPGVLVFELRVFEDERGFFFESFHEEHYSPPCPRWVM